MKKSIILAMSALLATPVLAEVTVQGVIRDAYTQEPLAGVRVQAFTNSKVSTMTDGEGQYKITLPDYVSSLRVQRSGYNDQQISVSNRQGDLDIILYSSVFKETVGLSKTSVQSISNESSDLNSDISIDNQIVDLGGGQIRSNSRGSVPGLGAFMLMNGINSLNANTQPLIVVDGVIMDMQYDRTCAHEGFYNNLLANISVHDIASVSILRNGTAIYGAKGANGVILIDTKRSHSFTTKIDVNIASSFENTPKQADMMNASQYRNYVAEMLGTTGTTAQNFNFLREDPNYYYYKVYHNETDWSKEVYQQALTQQYSINVQGGDDVAMYHLSVGYAKADATLKKNDFSRFNLRLNSDVNLTDKISIRLDAAYSDVNRNMRDDGAPTNMDKGVISSPAFLSMIKSPFLSPYQYDNKGNLSHALSQADDYLDWLDAENQSLANPASILYYGDARNKNLFGNRMITLGITPKAKFKHNLTLTDAFSFILFNTDEGYYLPVNGTPAYKIEGVTKSVHNNVRSYSSHQYFTTNDLRLAWNYAKEGHNLDLVGGWRMNLSRYQQNGILGYDSGNDKLPNMSTSLQYKKTFGSTEKSTTLTCYMQGDYNWAGKYFVNAGFSMEADSRFGKDADKSLNLFGVAWGLFPSINGSWVASNESWFPATDWVNYVRLNAGFDITGNSNIDADASQTYFKGQNMLGSVTGTVIAGIGNTEIKWESTKRLTFGLETNLLQNRLSLAVNGFKSTTSDLLSIQALPWVIGLDETWGNGGELKNVGFDVNVQGKVINTRDWQWQLGATVGHYKNEITKLPNGNIFTDAYNGTIATMVGQPVGLFYGYETNGVYSTTAEAETAGNYIIDANGQKCAFQGGDVKFVNHDSNPEINENDRVVIGNPNPDIYGNINSHLQWKNLALDVIMSYSVGNDIYNYQRSLLEAGSRFQNQTTALCGRWTAEGQHTDVPRISFQDKMGNSRFSDRWIEDGSYLRLKNVTLSYKWDFQSRYIQGVTVWGSGSNLLTLTKYLGNDPEFSASNNILYQGIDCGWLPNNRNFSVGVKINL